MSMIKLFGISDSNKESDFTPEPIIKFENHLGGSISYQRFLLKNKFFFNTLSFNDLLRCKCWIKSAYPHKIFLHKGLLNYIFLSTN